MGGGEINISKFLRFLCGCNFQDTLHLWFYNSVLLIWFVEFMKFHYPQRYPLYNRIYAVTSNNVYLSIFLVLKLVREEYLRWASCIHVLSLWALSHSGFGRNTHYSCRGQAEDMDTIDSLHVRTKLLWCI